MKPGSGSSIRYASILMGYPVSAFVLLKIVSHVFVFQPDKWVYLVVILVAHVFSLVYIVRGMNESD
jgi:hypothetical protein